jgi:hypothetical protein
MSLVLDGTNGLSDVDGSAATPAIRGSDANTGVFFGTDIVGVSTGGTERVRVDASGNVGIGTDSPAAKLDVSGVTKSSSINSGVFTANRNSASPNQIAFENNGTTTGFIGANSDATTIFSDASGDEKARIDTSGNFKVATTTTLNFSSTTANGFMVDDGGTVWASSNASASLNLQRTGSDGGVAAFRRNTAQVGAINVTTTATSYLTSSDYRLKNTVAPMTGALATVALLKPVTYKWNADNSQSQGFIAHELQAVVPEAVTGEKDAVDAEGNPQYQGIDTSFLVATLTAAIQEQQSIISALTARVEALEGAQA